MMGSLKVYKCPKGHTVSERNTVSESNQADRVDMVNFIDPSDEEMEEEMEEEVELVGGPEDPDYYWCSTCNKAYPPRAIRVSSQGGCVK